MKTDLLNLICCPETHQELTFADEATIARLNDSIAAGIVKNRAGSPVTEKIEGGLIREDRQFLYPIRHDIPVMLVEEAIPLAG